MAPKTNPLPPPDGAHLLPMPDDLLNWYDRSARTMPWRNDPTPYHVLVSEIMLQQTQVETVIPYFNRFVAELPDFLALAYADPDRLLKLWQGLGYYRRAHNLQRAAKEVAERFGGMLPADYEAIRSLPGVGDYTAGAVASIAFGLPVPAVDGNVLRVMTRLTGWEADIMAVPTKKACAALVRGLIPAGRAGDFTQALMELGALICRPGEQAKCGECPLSGLCVAHREGRVAELPIKRAAKARREEERTILVVRQRDGKILVRQRPSGGLLGGLYEPVNLAGRLDEVAVQTWIAEQGGKISTLQPMGTSDHIFSHITWHMTGWLVEVDSLSIYDGQFVSAEALRQDRAWPAAFRYFMQQIL